MSTIESNYVILEALASDLKRVTLGIQRGSLQMAACFAAEALQRKRQVNLETVDRHVAFLLERIESALKEDDVDCRAEDALMYSTLVQNWLPRVNS